MCASVVYKEVRLDYPNELSSTPLNILILEQLKVYQGKMTSNNINPLVKLR